MRRILWSLAASSALGVGMSWSMAQDNYRLPSQSPSRTSMSFGSGRTIGDPTGATAERKTYSDLFGRSDTRPFPGESQQLPPAGSLTETRAGDLFRRDQRSSASGESPSGADLLDQFQQVSAQNADPQQDVVHAEFQRSPGQSDPIEQVRGGDNAREFPQAVPSSVGAASRTAETFDAFRSQPGGSRLTEPISTSPSGRSVQQFSAVQQQTTSSRGVTFTRSTPVAAPAVAPVARPTAMTTIAPTAAPAPAPVATVSATPAVDALGTVAQTISSGRQAPSVSLEWVAHSGINVGQECKFSLKVQNSGIIAAREIEVHAHVPTSVRVVSVSPQPVASDTFMSWTFAELQPGQEKVIDLALVPSAPGKLDVRADVRFTGVAATSLMVSEPLLEVELSGPKKVLIGEPASQTVTVKNPGSGIATNVEVEAIIPGGLEHARGERLVMDVGSLNPGESRNVRLALAAVKGGAQIVQVQARADGDLVRNTTSEVFVVAPSLATLIDGPTLRYLGRPAVYTVAVKNEGEITVENVRVMQKVPEGFEVLETDRGAQFDRSNRIVNWFVGRLAAGQQSEMKLTVRPDQLGSFTHFVRATSEHGAISDAQFTTNVEGTASLAMEIRDLDDPVEVGG
ncbi:MAG: hypothetical protein ACK5Q5_07410, partial [Planctomycetaceae bacterium]